MVWLIASVFYWLNTPYSPVIVWGFYLLLLPEQMGTPLKTSDPLETISSPCVSNCCLNEEDICLGCFRSLDEILQWRAISDQQRQTLIVLAQAREAEYRLKSPK